MSKELNAFNRLVNSPNTVYLGSRINGKSELCKKAFEQKQKDIETVQKSLKAQEIAKTKRVDIAHLQDSKDCREYNEVVRKLATLWRVLPLTEEEYQLVKEIYCYEKL